MRPIGLDEIKSLIRAKQYFQDCYLVSGIGALAKSKNGEKVLAKSITHTDNGYCIKFSNVNKKSEDFFVTQKEIDDLVYMDKYLNPIPIDSKFPHNPIIKAVEVAMNKLLGKHPPKKPLLCRIPSCNEKFEFNKPSNFLEMFTGKKPHILNESGIKLNLRSKKNECIDLLNRISEDSDNAFVAGTAMTLNKKLHNFHCYNIHNINKESRTIDLFDHRGQNNVRISYDEAINNLKYIVGYFGKDLT